MNVLVVSQYFWPENFRINDLVIGLVEKSHTVTVLTGLPNYPGGALFDGYGYFKKSSETYHGVQVIRVPLVPRGKGGKWRLMLNYVSFACMASLIGPWRCRGQYDVIFVYEPSPITVGLPAIVMKWLKKAPVFFWVLDLWPESLVAAGGVRFGTLLGLVCGMTRFIYRNCDRILVQSRAFVPNILQFGVDRERILYFPSWAEALYQAVPYSQALRKELAIPDGFAMMFAGNMGASQDFEHILDAADILKDYSDIHWLIVGDGRILDWVRSEVHRRRLQDNVLLLGRHPLKRMPEFFALANTMLVSLKSNPVFALTIPGKVQSYLACGRPVIAMLEGEGARVIEESGAGWACASGDAQALAQLVLRMYRTPREQREAMGLAGRDYFEHHFDREMLFSRLVSWMQKEASGGLS